jgi:hypothetical protein
MWGNLSNFSRQWIHVLASFKQCVCAWGMSCGTGGIGQSECTGIYPTRISTDHDTCASYVTWRETSGAMSADPREKHSHFTQDPLQSPMTQTHLEDHPTPSNSPMQEDYQTRKRSSPVESTLHSTPQCPNFSPSAAEQVSYTPDTPTSLLLEGREPDLSYYKMASVRDTQKATEYVSDASMEFHPASWTLQAPAADDTSLEDEPSRHVDYLSHDWKEDDIWFSWRCVVSRGNNYSNGVRLENASWRACAKTKNNLGTISSESLDW